MMSMEYMYNRIKELLFELEQAKFRLYILNQDIKAAEKTIDNLRGQLAKETNGDSLVDVDWGEKHETH